MDVLMEDNSLKRDVTLSIIVVSYNEIEYIDETLYSIFHQNIDYKYEIIIGDDGSTDGSIEQINEYMKQYPNLVKSFVMPRDNENNIIASIRVSNLLKRGFSIASGKYILILSADDILMDENSINNSIKFLENNCEYVATCCEYIMFWPDNSKQLFYMRKSLNQRIFWGSHYMHVSSFVFSRDCVNNILDRFCDDTGLMYSILKTGKVKYLEYVGFGYRQREKSIMHTSDKLELYVLELAIVQDCLNSGWCRYGSLARVYKAVCYTFRKRKELKCTKYKKYLDSCDEYQNNILGLLFAFDSFSILKRMIITIKIYSLFLLHWWWVFLRKITCIVAYLVH